MGIEIKNLSKVFPSGTKALDNVNIKFKKNQITGLIGFNGSGKTTTFNILTNFIEDATGNILFDNEKPSETIRKQISYLGAGSETKNLAKVKSHLLQIAYINEMNYKDASKKINDAAKKLDFTKFLTYSISSLSKGNQQKIKIISSLLNPRMKYLFLDEPFDGLDPIMVNKAINLYTTLKNVTIILTSHRMEVVNDVCKEFFVLKDGKLTDFRVIDKNEIIIEVNKEVSLIKIKSMANVLEIIKNKNSNLIRITSIKYFKDINKILTQAPNYEYSTIKEKNLTEIVFERYGE